MSEEEQKLVPNNEMLEQVLRNQIVLLRSVRPSNLAGQEVHGEIIAETVALLERIESE